MKITPCLIPLYILISACFFSCQKQNDIKTFLEYKEKYILNGWWYFEDKNMHIRVWEEPKIKDENILNHKNTMRTYSCKVNFWLHSISKELKIMESSFSPDILSSIKVELMEDYKSISEAPFKSPSSFGTAKSDLPQYSEYIMNLRRYYKDKYNEENMITDELISKRFRDQKNEPASFYIEFETNGKSELSEIEIQKEMSRTIFVINNHSKYESFSGNCYNNLDIFGKNGKYFGSAKSITENIYRNPPHQW